MRAPLLLTLLLAACGSPGFDPPPRQVPEAGDNPPRGQVPDAGEDPPPGQAQEPPVEEEAQSQEVYRSGSRLRAEVLQGADGSSQFAGWYDTTLGVECHYVVAADGETRCLPRVAGSPVFTDPECQRRAVLILAQLCVPAAPRFLTITETDVCPVVTRVFDAGAEAASASYWTELNDGRCYEAPLSDVWQMYELGPEEPPAAFVRATRARQ